MQTIMFFHWKILNIDFFSKTDNVPDALGQNRLFCFLLDNCKKVAVFMSMSNLGQFRENVIFLSITVELKFEC